MPPRINIPPLTRGLLAALIVLSLFNAGARYRSFSVNRSLHVSFSSRQYYAPYFTIVPGVSIIFPWVFVTATFAEQNLVGLIITGAALFYGGRYLERAWSSTEYLKFILIVAFIPNFLSFITYILLFVLTGNEYLSSTAISGGIAIQSSFLVAFKQLVPEHTVTLFRNVSRVRVKHFPAVFLLANTFSGLFFYTYTAMLLAWLGFFTSWVYLRFYRVSPSLASSGTGESALLKGDASDTFAFVGFWPDIVQPFLGPVADQVYNLLVAVRICTPFSAEDVDFGNEQAQARESRELPSLLNTIRGSGRREEAERRRALALRVLDQRLNTGSARAVQPAPAAMPVASPASATRIEASPARSETKTPVGGAMGNSSVEQTQLQSQSQSQATTT